MSSSSKTAAPASTASSSVTLKWRKKVKMEYARLRQQKKFRHQDDMRLAWSGNRATLDSGAEAAGGAAGEFEVKREPGVEEAGEGGGERVRRHKTPVW